MFKKGDDIENTYTFKNTGQKAIPAGCMLVMIDGDIELNVAGVRVMQDVRPNDFFKLKVKTKAPE